MLFIHAAISISIVVSECVCRGVWEEKSSLCTEPINEKRINDSLSAISENIQLISRFLLPKYQTHWSISQLENMEMSGFC